MSDHELKVISNPISGVELTENFYFEQHHVDSVLHYLSSTVQKDSYSTYRKNKIEEHFCMEIVSYAKLLNYSDIHNETKVGGKNTNQGQRNLKNPKEDDIKMALENQNRLDLPPMSVIKLKDKKLIEEYDGKEYIQGDGRTRRKIKENFFKCERDIFTIYSLKVENKKTLKRALSFLTHAKNAENNNNVYAEQTRQHIIDAYVNDFMEGIIELDENLNYKNFDIERENMKFTFGANKIFQKKNWTTVANSVLDSARSKYIKESNNIGETDHALWERKYSLPTWASGNIDQLNVSHVSRTPYKFRMAKYDENDNLIERGRYIYFHDVTTQNDFVRMYTMRRKSWPSDASYQTEEMKAIFEATGRDISKENPNDYQMDILLYIPSMKSSEVSKNDIWSIYTKTFNNFIKFQFDFIFETLKLHVPNVDLEKTYVERYAGGDENALVRIVGAVPSCTKFQHMDRIVKFNSNVIENSSNKDRFFFDDSVENQNLIPIPSPNKHAKRKTVKKEQEFKKKVIDFASYSMISS